jgi:hypothetical protein
MKISPDTFNSSRMTEIRRNLHRFLELAFMESQIDALIIEELDHLGISYTSEIAGTGIVAALGSYNAGSNHDFGSVHSVITGAYGVGDPRRGGSVMVVQS